MNLEKTRFTEHLTRLNALRFTKWVFDPGMLYRSELKWWGDKGYREHRHNGLDLQLYETSDGTLQAISGGTKIPIIYDGKIVRRIKDFLGYTLFVEHEICEKDCRLFTIYGHVLQTAEVSIGRLLNEGSVVATLAEAKNMKVPDHLHLSVALVPKTIPSGSLTWKTLHEAEDIHFFDPGHII
jgi:hypothetical protein